MLTENIINVGFVQYNPAIGEIQQNFEKVEELCENFSPSTELIVLPELAFSGYNFRDTAAILSFAEVAATGKTCQFLTKIAKKHNTYIVAGLPEILDENEKNIIYNSSILVGPNGFIDVYRKIHLFDREKLIFQPGTNYKVVKVPRIKASGHFSIGLLICFDWIFAESWLAMFDNGADVIAHCTNLVLPKKAQKAVPIMAMMHKFAVVTSNRWGTENMLMSKSTQDSSEKLRFTGNSLIANHEGKILTTADAEKDQICEAEIDLAEIRNKQITQRNNLITDRLHS